MFEKVTGWIKAHPWEAGGGAFLVVVLFFFATRGSGGGQAAGPDANLSAYLAAETAQNNTDAALNASLAQTAASTTQAGIAAKEQVDVNNTWAASDLATTQSNNATSLSSQLIDGFSKLANNLGTVLTNSTSSGSASSSQSNSGFNLFGLFGGGSNDNSVSQSQSGTSTQTFVANSQQAAAEEELASIANTNFHIGH